MKIFSEKKSDTFIFAIFLALFIYGLYLMLNKYFFLLTSPNFQKYIESIAALGVVIAAFSSLETYFKNTFSVYLAMITFTGVFLFIPYGIIAKTEHKYNIALIIKQSSPQSLDRCSITIENFATRKSYKNYEKIILCLSDEIIFESLSKEK